MVGVLLIGALLAVHHVEAQQPTAPVFHAEAYVVTQLINFVNRDGTATRGLTAADVRARSLGRRDRRRSWRGETTIERNNPAVVACRVRSCYVRD